MNGVRNREREMMCERERERRYERVRVRDVMLQMIEPSTSSYVEVTVDGEEKVDIPPARLPLTAINAD